MTVVSQHSNGILIHRDNIRDKQAALNNRRDWRHVRLEGGKKWIPLKIPTISRGVSPLEETSWAIARDFARGNEAI